MKSTKSRPSSQGRYEKKRRMSGTFTPLPKPMKHFAYQTNTISSGPEVKNVDVAVAITPPPSAVTFTAGTLLNGINIGTSPITRVGRKIRMRKLGINITFALAPTSVGGSSIRTLVIYDKQSNLAAPAITDILNTNEFNSFNLLAYSDRFITLANDISEPISVQNNFSVARKLNIKMDLETVYDDVAGGTIASIHTGAIYIFFAQDSAITVAGPPILAISRLRYTDV